MDKATHDPASWLTEKWLGIHSRVRWKELSLVSVKEAALLGRILGKLDVAAVPAFSRAWESTLHVIGGLTAPAARNAPPPVTALSLHHSIWTGDGETGEGFALNGSAQNCLVFLTLTDYIP